MKWEKKGQIFEPEENYEWWRSHSMAPSAVQINSTTIRVFIGCLDKNGISRIGYVDVNANNPSEVLSVSENPVLDVGKAGTFDENGVFPASVTKIDDQIFLYYTGFQLGYKVRYYMFGGIAISLDNGKTFKKAKECPVLDRADEGLCFRGGPTVLYEDGIYKMWYSSGTDWVNVGGKMRPTYDIRYQESTDGINTTNYGKLCLSYDRDFEHGLGRPQIIKDNGIYKLFYTRRTKDMKYYSGYSESVDGINWVRKDSEIGIEHSENSWDSEMLYFPNVIEVNKKFYLFYNGNNFGEKGFGYAELISW